MKFRFTLNYPGAQSGPIAIPALSQWSTQVGAGEEWTEGLFPFVDISATFPTEVNSEYLYVDYGFEDGVEYTITLTYTATYDSGIASPREVSLDILDNSFAVQFSEIGSFPLTPGGQGSVTIQFTANATSTKIGFKVSVGGVPSTSVTLVANEVSGTSVNPMDLPQSLEINEPDGWKQAVLALKRDQDFHSLIEFFDGSFIFYGDNGVVNGGLHFIEALEEEKGDDVTINLLIEIAPDDETYETCYEGQLDLPKGERLPKNKYRIPIIRDDFWAKFYSRWKTPVDLQSPVDLDDNPIVDLVDPVELSLTDQKIVYFSDYNWLYSMTYPDESGDVTLTYLMLAFDEEIRSDIKLFSLARQATDAEGSMIFGLFEAPWDGEYRLQMRLVFSDYDGADWSGTTTTRLRIRKVNQSSFDVYQFNGGITDGSDFALIIDVDQRYTLARGEQLSLMLHRATSGLPVTVFGKTPITWLEVDLATTTTTDLSGEETIDGTLTSASRVLVKNQGNPYENGIYVTGAGAWTRATDMDTADEFNDVAVFVSGGTDQTGTAWRQTQLVSTVGVDSVQFAFAEPSDEWQKPFDTVYDTANYVLTGADPRPDDDELFQERTVPGSFIKITANTVYRTTQSAAFLIHDALAAILKSLGLGEDNPLYSELLGSLLTNARQYMNDGCAWRYVLLRGLHVRGYTLTEKPFAMSVEQWWKGADPIFCLGLGYETIEGSTVNPSTAELDALEDWADAPSGDYPGAWNYSIFPLYDIPTALVVGLGTQEGYTCGEMDTIAGETYQFSVAIQVLEVTPPIDTNYTVTYAILDSSYNELAIEEFNYLTAGLKKETFTLSPPSNGTYFAVRVRNDSVVGTFRTIVVTMAVNGDVDELLDDAEFDSAFVWANDGSGEDWSFGSGSATITLDPVGFLSKSLVQEFTGGAAGRYIFVSQYTVTDAGVGESVDITVNLYDEDDNLIGTKNDSVGDDGTSPFILDVTTVVPVAKVELIAELIAGSTDVTVDIPFAYLYLVLPTASIVTPDERVIRVEEREFFYQEEMSVMISNIEEIIRKKDTDKIYNKIEIGYNQWQSEDVSGIDDPQTKHVYATRFKKTGEGITIHSDFIAASLALETTRRQSIDKSTDYKFDNNTFIVSINTTDVSPDAYVPELGNVFSSIVNLLNSETRYNVRLSVARNFLRWRKWLNGCLQSYLTSFYKFVSGEGNFDMVTTFDQSPDCLGEDNEGESLSEKQDIRVTDEVIHTHHYYEIDVPMQWETYKTISQNRRNAIGISLTAINHVPLFIESLEYEVMSGKAKISGWTKEYFPLEVIEGPAATQDCRPATECVNPITDQFGEPIRDENGVCITFTDPDIPDEDGIFDETFDSTFE